MPEYKKDFISLSYFFVDKPKIAPRQQTKRGGDLSHSKAQTPGSTTGHGTVNYHQFLLNL